MNITDNTAKKLHARIAWIRYGGKYPTYESLRKKDKPEPFVADRVRQLMAQRTPQCQRTWLAEVGAAWGRPEASDPSLMTSLG